MNYQQINNIIYRRFWLSLYNQYYQQCYVIIVIIRNGAINSELNIQLESQYYRD